MPFVVGEVVEAKNTDDQWAEAQILLLDLEEDEALVRFKVTTSWCDEWVSFKKIRKSTGASADAGPVRQKFRIGEKVMAKWTNQVKPYPAEILSYDINTDSYQIRFYDGFIKTYKSTRIQKMTRADRERLALDPPPPPVLEPVNKSVFDTSGIGTKEERRARKRKLDVVSLFKPNSKGILDDQLSDRSDSPSSQVSGRSGRKRSRTESVRSCSPIAGPSRRRSIQPIPVPVSAPPTVNRSFTPIQPEDLEKASRRERTKRFSVAELFGSYKKSPAKIESPAAFSNPRTYGKQQVVKASLNLAELKSPKSQMNAPMHVLEVSRDDGISKPVETKPDVGVTIQQRTKNVEVCILDDETEVEILDTEFTVQKQPPGACESGQSVEETSNSKPDSIAETVIEALKDLHDEIAEQKRAVVQPDSNSDGESDVIVLSEESDSCEEVDDKEVPACEGVLPCLADVVEVNRDVVESPEHALEQRDQTATVPNSDQVSAERARSCETPVAEEEMAKEQEKVGEGELPASEGAAQSTSVPPSRCETSSDVPCRSGVIEASKDGLVDAADASLDKPKQVTIQQIIVRRPGQEMLNNDQRIQDIELTTSKKAKVPDEIFLQDTNLPAGWMKKATRCSSGSRKWSVTVIAPCGTKFKSRKSIAAYLDSQGLDYPISCFNFSLGVEFIRHFSGRSQEINREKKTQEKSVLSKPVSHASQFLPTPNDFLCPGRMCNKSFRSAMLLHMHIKHQHPDLSKADIKLPKVSDLAYARTAGEEESSKARGEADLPTSNFSANFREFLSRREENLVREVSGGSSLNAGDGESSSGMVVEAVEENDDLVHCICGYNEEDGLMIQCDICLCWQHGVCFGILSEEEVSDRFTCSFCTNPKKVRASMRLAYDENWLKDGKLARFSFVDKKNEHVNPKRISTLRKAHSGMAETLDIGNFLHKLSKKVEIAKNKDHPKLYLWAGTGENSAAKEEQKKEESSQSRFEEMPVTASQEAADFLMEELPEDAFDTSFLESSDIVALLPTSSELEQMTDELSRKGEPQAEARINNDDCHRNLVSHIKESHAVIEKRLEMLEKLADMLEKDSTPNLGARSELQKLMKDVTELSLLSTFS